MSESGGIVDHVLDLMRPLGPVSARRMFGGHGIFLDGLMFALIAGDELYLKVDDACRGRFEAAGLEPFVYSRKAKPVSLSYYRAPEQALESAAGMIEWAGPAFEAALRGR